MSKLFLTKKLLKLGIELCQFCTGNLINLIQTLDCVVTHNKSKTIRNIKVVL